MKHLGDNYPIRLTYKPYFFSQRIIFFSHNKSVNSTFSHAYQPNEQSKLFDTAMRRIGQTSSNFTGMSIFGPSGSSMRPPRRPPCQHYYSLLYLSTPIAVYKAARSTVNESDTDMNWIAKSWSSFRKGKAHVSGLNLNLRLGDASSASLEMIGAHHRSSFFCS